MESGKYGFPMWFVSGGPYSFWFRASGRLNRAGRRFWCES